MDLITKEQMAELEAKHIRIARLQNHKAGFEVVFRKPRRAEFKQLRARAHNPPQRAEAQEILARQCVVAVFSGGTLALDDKARLALDELLEDYPSVCDSEAASALFQRLMDGAVEEDAKT